MLYDCSSSLKLCLSMNRKRWQVVSTMTSSNWEYMFSPRLDKRAASVPSLVPVCGVVSYGCSSPIASHCAGSPTTTVDKPPTSYLSAYAVSNGAAWHTRAPIRPIIRRPTMENSSMRMRRVSLKNCWSALSFTSSVKSWKRRGLNQ